MMPPNVSMMPGTTMPYESGMMPNNGMIPGGNSVMTNMGSMSGGGNMMQGPSMAGNGGGNMLQNAPMSAISNRAPSVMGGGGPSPGPAGEMTDQYAGQYPPNNSNSGINLQSPAYSQPSQPPSQSGVTSFSQQPTSSSMPPYSSGITTTSSYNENTQRGPISEGYGADGYRRGSNMGPDGFNLQQDGQSNEYNNQYGRANQYNLYGQDRLVI